MNVSRLHLFWYALWVLDVTIISYIADDLICILYHNYALIDQNECQQSLNAYVCFVNQQVNICFRYYNDMVLSLHNYFIVICYEHFDFNQ